MVSPPLSSLVTKSLPARASEQGNWRARCYLIMFMEVRYMYIYIYMRLFLIRMCALSVLRIKFKS